MTVKSLQGLLGLAAAGLLAAVAVPEPAAGRSLTEAEQWRTRGGMLKQNWCCGVANDCANTPKDEIPDCGKADPCRGYWLIDSKAVATCVETDEAEDCEDGTDNQECATKKRCARSSGTGKCITWPNGVENPARLCRRRAVSAHDEGTDGRGCVRARGRTAPLRLLMSAPRSVFSRPRRTSSGPTQFVGGARRVL